MRIGVVAPSTPIRPELADEARRLAETEFPEAELHFHPQCFLEHKHFAGPDGARAEAFLEVANDPGFDALWFARGGYGSCRIAEAVLAGLGPAAAGKTYLGYSDAGFLLAGLYRAGVGRPVHGAMPGDLRRKDGAEAVRRSLAWMVRSDRTALDTSLDAALPTVAFNLTVLSQLLGTPLQPDLAGHVLMLEDVAEHTYRTDRALFHITGNPGVRQVAGIRFGRCTDVPTNDPDFGVTEEELVIHWCERAGIPYLGRCDIGHDAGNKIVPFGRL